MIPIPSHLTHYPWYAPLQAAILAQYGCCRHDPGEAPPKWPDLIDADLIDADLIDADLIDADLTGARLTRADLTRADLTDADLTDANLTDVIGYNP